MNQLAIEAHGLPGQLQSLGSVDVAGLEALALVGSEVCVVEGAGTGHALVEAVHEHLALELLGMHFSLALHFYSFLLLFNYY